jgi:hypothetical protein
MQYKTTYTIQRKVSVIVEITDGKLNEQFEKLGAIKSDEDFVSELDPRWEIEAIAYDAFSSCDESVEYDDNEEIVNRTIERL